MKNRISNGQSHCFLEKRLTNVQTREQESEEESRTERKDEVWVLIQSGDKHRRERGRKHERSHIAEMGADEGNPWYRTRAE